MSQVMSIGESEAAVPAGVSPRSRQAFTGLYDRYAPGLLGVIVHITGDHKAAEGILQQVFVELWTNFDPFDTVIGAFPLLLRAAKRRAHEFVNARDYKNQSASLLVSDRIGDSQPVSNSGTAENEVLRLMFYGSISMKDACRRLNCDEEILKKMLRSAVTKLKNLAR